MEAKLLDSLITFGMVAHVTSYISGERERETIYSFHDRCGKTSTSSTKENMIHHVFIIAIEILAFSTILVIQRKQCTLASASTDIPVLGPGLLVGSGTAHRQAKDCHQNFQAPLRRCWESKAGRWYETYSRHPTRWQRRVSGLQLGQTRVVFFFKRDTWCPSCTRFLGFQKMDAHHVKTVMSTCFQSVCTSLLPNLRSCVVLCCFQVCPDLLLVSWTCTAMVEALVEKVNAKKYGVTYMH